MKTSTWNFWSIVMILTYFGVTRAYAQRHGRTDSVQNYKSFQRVLDSILNISYERTNTWRYLRLSELLKPNRVTIEVLDPKANRTDADQGVLLRDVLATGERYRVVVFQQGRAFRDKQIVFNPELSTRSDITVAYVLNGKRLEQEPTLYAPRERRRRANSRCSPPGRY